LFLLSLITFLSMSDSTTVPIGDDVATLRAELEAARHQLAQLMQGDSHPPVAQNNTGDRQLQLNRAVHAAVAPAGGLGPVLLRPAAGKSTANAFARYREFADELKLTFVMVGMPMTDTEKLAWIARWGSAARTRGGRDSVDDEAYAVISTWKTAGLPAPSGAVVPVGAQVNNHDIIDRLLDGLLRTFATSEMVLADLLAFGESRVQPGTRIVDVVASFENALLAYKGHVHPATLAFMFVAKLSPDFRAELFARPNVLPPPADGDAGKCEQQFRSLMESARSVAASAKYATMPGASAGVRHDPMVIGAVDADALSHAGDDNDDVVAAVNRATSRNSNGNSNNNSNRTPAPSREAWLRARRLCIKCGLGPDDDPPLSVCPKHWKGASAKSGKAAQH
jgi:hypothetical protein